VQGQAALVLEGQVQALVMQLDERGREVAGATARCQRLQEAADEAKGEAHRLCAQLEQLQQESRELKVRCV
jgi:hypothetical protein